MPGSVHIAVGTDVAKAPSDSLALTNTVPTMHFDFDGTGPVMARVPSKFVDVNGVSIGTIVTVWTPDAGKRIRLLGMSVSVSAAASVLFEDNSAGNFVFRTPTLAANTAYTFMFGGRGILLSAADNVLKATGSAAANLTGTLFGIEE